MAIRLITFDATRTLLQFRTSVPQQYVKAALEEGLVANPDLIHDKFKVEWKKMTSQHPCFGKTTGLTWQEWWTQVVTGSFSDYIKSKEDEEKVRKTAESLIQSFATSSAWNTSVGATDLLEYLNIQNGIQLGVISNFDPRLHSILKAQKLHHYFSFVLTSYEVGFEKPNKKMFEVALGLAERNKGLVFHIGDNEQLDYHAAASASGIQGLLLTEDKVSDAVEPKYAFSTLAAIKDYFKLLLHQGT